MFPPELLYQLSARDQQVTWLDPIFDRGDVTTAAVSVAATLHTVPDGRVLVVHSVHAEARPGAAQACTELAIVARAAGMPNRRLAASFFTVTANLPRSVDWSGSILLPPDGVIIAVGTFDAGVAGNNVLGDVMGVLIPVGNIQRV